MNWKSIKNSRKFFHDNRKNSFPHRFTCILSIWFSSSYEPESNNGSDWILPKRMSIYVSEIHNSNSCQLWKRTMRTQTVKEFKSSYSIRTICWAHECSKEHRSHTADWVLEGASTRCDFPSFCRLNGNYLDFCVGFKLFTLWNFNKLMLHIDREERYRERKLLNSTNFSQRAWWSVGMLTFALRCRQRLITEIFQRWVNEDSDKPKTFRAGRDVVEPRG